MENLDWDSLDEEEEEEEECIVCGSKENITTYYNKKYCPEHLEKEKNRRNKKGKKSVKRPTTEEFDNLVYQVKTLEEKISNMENEILHSTTIINEQTIITQFTDDLLNRIPTNGDLYALEVMKKAGINHSLPEFRNKTAMKRKYPQHASLIDNLVRIEKGGGRTLLNAVLPHIIKIIREIRDEWIKNDSEKKQS